MWSEEEGKKNQKDPGSRQKKQARGGGRKVSPKEIGGKGIPV